MKYVVVENFGHETVLCTPDVPGCIKHSQLAPAASPGVVGMVDRIVSAGFFDPVTGEVYGESESLHLGTRPQDVALIREQLLARAQAQLADDKKNLTTLLERANREIAHLKKEKNSQWELHRRQLWVTVAAHVSGADNCTDPDTPARWARVAAAEFEKDFPKPEVA